MRVVIVGDRNRSEFQDKPLVYDILEKLMDKYGKLMIVTRSCDRGVGKIIKNRCKKDSDNPEFDMIEVELIHIIKEPLPRNEFLHDFNTLNSTLAELGDEFHILTDEEPRGSMQDMVERIVRIGQPFSLYKPSEVANGYKEPAMYANLSKTTSEP